MLVKPTSHRARHLQHHNFTESNSGSNSKGVLPNVTVSLGNRENQCASTPCQVVAGCPVILVADFIAPRYLENLKPQIIAVAEGVTINYPLGQNDACKGISNTQCPIVKGEKVSYNYSLTLPGVLPEVGVKLQLTIIDKDLDEDVICFAMEAQVKNMDCPSKS